VPQSERVPVTGWRWPGLAGAVIAGLLLGMLALGPGLGRGFLLSYDMVAVPRQPFTAAMFGLTGTLPRAVPSDAVAAAVARALPADVVQKLLLLSIFVLACSGMAALLAGEHWLARMAGAVFYAWNPFVAERLIIGQWALLLGYGALPWVLRAVAMPAGPRWRWAGRLMLALLPAAVGGFSAMCLSALVVLPAAACATGRTARQRVLSAGTALLILAVLSLPWLIPALAWTVHTSSAGVAAFAARADTPFGALGSLLMLGGVWNAQAVPAGYGSPLSVLWMALALAALAGYLAFARRRWPGLGIAAAAGLALACIGLTGPGRDLLRAMIEFWPGFAVLRDGQQFVAPLALAEAAGAGLGTAGTLMGVGRFLKERKPQVQVWAVEPPAGEMVDGLKNLDEGFIPEVFTDNDGFNLLDRSKIVGPRESVEWTRRLADVGKAVLLVEQRARAALGIADWTLVLVSGMIRLEGRPGDLLERPDFEELFLGAGTLVQEG